MGVKSFERAEWWRKEEKIIRLVYCRDARRRFRIRHDN